MKNKTLQNILEAVESNKFIESRKDKIIELVNILISENIEKAYEEYILSKHYKQISNQITEDLRKSNEENKAKYYEGLQKIVSATKNKPIF